MSEELQHLIERIRSEAVETGERQAADLLRHAKEKAADIVREAETRAASRLEQAEQDAAIFMERSLQTLHQAARDLLISVGQGVENILSDLADGAVAKALRPEVLEQILVRMAESYFAKGGRETRLEVLCSPEDQKTLQQFFTARYHEQLGQGIELRSDEGIFKGFRVGVKGGTISHDFTQESIAEALSQFLRPQLAAIVHRAARAPQGTPAA